MKKALLVFLMLFFALALIGKAVEKGSLESGESAIFLKSGERVVGEIVDISSARLVLELKDGRNFALAKIWMINFVNTEWNFPEERGKIRSDEHYLFLRNGDIVSGALADFSSQQRVFELKGGEKIGYGRVQRIYFEKKVPEELLATLHKEEPEKPKKEPERELGPSEKLKSSEELKSINGKYLLRMQGDGNLVAYDSRGKALWGSDTAGSGAVECVMQSDGNLVLRDKKGKAVWATYTDGFKNSKLAIQNDGNLVLYNERGLAVWAKGRIKDSMSGGENLLADEFLKSQNRKYALRMQRDGNLVAYDSEGKALWNSATPGSGAVECVMQSDGNLVLRDRNGKVVWAANTQGHPNATLLMGDDGNVVMLDEKGVLFWSNGKPV
jgi:hypothetical protein